MSCGSSVSMLHDRFKSTRLLATAAVSNSLGNAYNAEFLHTFIINVSISELRRCTRHWIEDWYRRFTISDGAVFSIALRNRSSTIVRGCVPSRTFARLQSLPSECLCSSASDLTLTHVPIVEQECEPLLRLEHLVLANVATAVPGVGHVARRPFHLLDAPHRQLRVGSHRAQATLDRNQIQRLRCVGTPFLRLLLLLLMAVIGLIVENRAIELVAL